MLMLDKFSLIIVTRCNLQCRLCCEYVPQNKPFPDMTVEEAGQILSAAFKIADRIKTLHLTGGGEPFLHPKLAELINTAMEYADQFDKLMLFTNSTIPPSDKLLDKLKQYNDRILVQTSLYGINPLREKEILKILAENNINCKIEKYYGDNQSFGGWVDFGLWEQYARTPEKLENIFHNCAVTRNMNGNWRTRDGKVHWCSRSQRGMELGLLPDNPDEYVDLFSTDESIEQKRDKFRWIASKRFLLACDYCSGDQGTDNPDERFCAAEQI